MPDEFLFVYGMLRRDTQSEMYRLLAKYADFASVGVYQGRLFRIDYYPGVVPSNNAHEKVKGEVYRLCNAEAVLSKLDEYEECGPGFTEPTEYIRRRQSIELADGTCCDAWVYLYNRSTKQLAQIVSGDFLSDASGR